MLRIEHVLIVDDDLVFSEVLKETLLGRGLHAEQAFSVDDAQKAFDGKRIDVVLLDASLDRELDGVEFLTRIKRHGFAGRVVAISGNPKHNKVLCENGADEAVLKNAAGVMAVLWR
jgi:DNA-binding response OmpR family regulator